jgi:hypothetical protein
MRAKDIADGIDLAELRWAHAQGRLAARQRDRGEALRQEDVVRSLFERGSAREQPIQ